MSYWDTVLLVLAVLAVATVFGALVFLALWLVSEIDSPWFTGLVAGIGLLGFVFGVAAIVQATGGA